MKSIPCFVSATSSHTGGPCIVSLAFRLKQKCVDKLILSEPYMLSEINAIEASGQ